MLEHDVIIVGVDWLGAARRWIARTDPSLNVAVVAKPIRFVPTQSLAVRQR